MHNTVSVWLKTKSLIKTICSSFRLLKLCLMMSASRSALDASILQGAILWKERVCAAMPTVASSFVHPVCVLSMVPKSVEVSLSAAVRRTRCFQEALKASATLRDCERQSLYSCFAFLQSPTQWWWRWATATGFVASTWGQLLYLSMCLCACLCTILTSFFFYFFTKFFLYF